MAMPTNGAAPKPARPVVTTPGAMPAPTAPAPTAARGALFDGSPDSSKPTARLGPDGKPLTDPQKVAAMKSDGIKPVTALGLIVPIVILILACVLWFINPAAALIVGIVALGLIGLWLLMRAQAKRKLGQPNQVGRRQAHGSYNQAGRAPFRRGVHGGHNGGGGYGSRHGGSYGGHRGSSSNHGGHGRDRWNPFRRNHNSRASTNGRGHSSSDNTRNPSSRSHDSGHRRSWNPLSKRGHGQGNSHGRSRSHYGSGSSGRGWGGSHNSGGSHGGGHRNSHGGHGSWRPWSRRHNRSHGNYNGSSSSGGTHGRGHNSGSGSSKRWYKPWAWKRKHSSPDPVAGSGSAPDPTNTGSGTNPPDSKPRRKWRDRWQREGSRSDKPNRWRRWRDHSNSSETQPEVESKPKRERRSWRKPWRRRAEQPEGPSYVDSERLDNTSTAYSMEPPKAIPFHPVIEPDGSESPVNSKPAVPLWHGAPTASTTSGGNAMSGEILGAVTGAPKAGAHLDASAATRTSGVNHVAMAEEFRHTAAKYMATGDRTLIPAAEEFLRRAAAADVVAQNRARETADQIARAAEATGGSTTSGNIG